MTTALQPVSHIRLDDREQAWIAGTSYKVSDIVLDHLAHGLSPEEIQYQHYGCPTLSQIHAALAYYYDHKEAVDAEISQQTKEIEALRAEAGESQVVKRLRAEGKLP